MKKLRVLMTLILTVVLSVAFLSGSVFAKSANSGNCGNKGGNVKWKISKKGVLTIYGKGKMADYTSGEPISADCTTPWSKQEMAGKVKKVVIKKGVTYIGNNAFTFCRGNVSIPSTVKKIGNHPFGGSIKSFTVHKKNKKFKSIKGVIFSKNGKTLIAYPANKSSKKYTVPKKVTVIGEQAFYGCINLTTVTLGENVKKVKDAAFYFGSVTEMYIKSEKLVEFGTYDDSVFWTSPPQVIYVPCVKLEEYSDLLKNQLNMGDTEIKAFDEISAE